jgi:tetratricopeptide (TPR) repeat protein
MKIFTKIYLSFILFSFSLIYAENYLPGQSIKGSPYIWHWPTTNVSWKLSVNAAPGFTYTHVQSLISNAYSAWQNVSTSDISFTYTGSVPGTYSRNDNVNGHYWVYLGDPLFTDGREFDPQRPEGPASAVTIITRDSYGEILDVDIVYNGEKEWYDLNDGQTWNDIQSVSTHEIGHSIGLDHTSVVADPMPVMTYSAPPSSWRRVLKWDDEKGASFLYGGRIIENETWVYNNYYFDWNLSVIPGITLTLQPGLTMYFKPNKYLTVNGSLSAVGNSNDRITFTIFGSGSWGGIQFNSGSSGNLQYCNIQYTNNGIYCYNSSPTIKYTTLDNNGTAVYCDYYSSPVLVGNNIRYNSNYGIRTNSYSSPNLTDNGYPGSNVIRNNGSNGLYATYNCNPNLNGYMTDGNSVFDNNSYEIVAFYNCTVNAERVWWGSHPPSDGEFYAYQSTINRNNPLVTNPNSGRLVVENNNNQTNGISFSIQGGEDELETALTKQREKKYDEAIQLFLNVFKKNKENQIGRYALIKIEECYTQAGKKNFIDYSKKELKPLIKEGTELYVVLLELETHQLVNAGYYKEAITNLITILKKYTLNESIEKNTLFRLGAFYTHYYGDEEKAEEYFTELRRKYPGDELIEQIEIVKGFGKTINNTEQSINLFSLEETVKETNERASEELLSNYPNPFNPSTTIQFVVPDAGKYILKVYNMLGQEVATLVDNELSSGIHKVNFDANNLSSGIYVYKLVGSKVNLSKKMILMK